MHGVVSGNCVEAKLTFVRNFVLSLVFYHSTAQINFIVGNMLICAVKWVWSELLRTIVVETFISADAEESCKATRRRHKKQ